MNDDGTNDDDSRDLPRPEIDPALTRSLLGGPDDAASDEDADEVDEASDAVTEVERPRDGAETGPWEQAAEVLQAVPDDEADVDADMQAEEAGRPEAVPVAAVVEDVPAPARDDVEAPADADDDETGSDDDDDAEELRLLRAIPLPARLEALLFAATEPLSLARLRSLTAADDPAELRRALDGLEAGYRERGSALHVVELGGGFVLRTAPDVAPAVGRLGRKRDQERLSSAALETLAIVAYRQPVLRVDVEKIRGVASGEVLRTLVEKGLVRVAGRADLPGSPLLYGTTQRFLELFGLRNLRDLPSDEQLLRKPG